MMCMFAFVYMSGHQSKWLLINFASFCHQSDIQHCGTSSSRGKSVSKQRLAERHLALRPAQITTHSCAGPFSSSSDRVGGLRQESIFALSCICMVVCYTVRRGIEVIGSNKIVHVWSIFSVLQGQFIIHVMLL